MLFTEICFTLKERKPLAALVVAGARRRLAHSDERYIGELNANPSFR
jgi:hypothetical protein